MRNDELMVLPPAGGRKRLFRKGLPEKLEPWFYIEEQVCDFAISGQGADTSVLHYLLDVEAGNLPVIILHSNKASAKAEVAMVWNNKFGSLDEGGTLWSADEGGFEPFLGMDDEDVIEILRKLAQMQNITCGPQFDKVAAAHLKILHLMECDNSLSGLFYLCSFDDMEELQGNILQLPCSSREKDLILANLGLANGQSMEQYDLFRMVVKAFARQAKTCGWVNDNEDGMMNITTALSRRAMLLLGISAAKAPMVMTYLREELLLHNDKEFLLIVDDVKLGDSGIISVLEETGRRFRVVLLSHNILGLIGGEISCAQSFCGGLDRIILLKHAVETDAAEVVKLLGTHEVERETVTKGTGQGFWDWMPKTQSRSVAVSTEDRQRVDARELLELKENKAIVFDMQTNGILRV